MARSIVQRRSGFTLIEIMIVIVIMTVIAALAVKFLPNLNKNKGVPNAVGQLEGWIRVTKSQALRDGAPRGVRLIVDADGNVRSLQYIEQPEPLVFNGNGIRARFETPFPPVPAISPDGQLLTVVTIGNILPGPIPPTWDNVRGGDYLELSEPPYGVYRIENVAGNTMVLDPSKLVDGTLTSPLGNPLLLATGFRVIRQPRPLVGEPLLEMHKDVFIDGASFLPLAQGRTDIISSNTSTVAILQKTIK